MEPTHEPLICPTFQLGYVNPPSKKPIKTKKVNGRAIKILPKTNKTRSSTTPAIDVMGIQKSWDTDVEMENSEDILHGIRH